MGRQAVPTIFAEPDGQDTLVIGPRHVKPCTDELLLAVVHDDGLRSVVFDRDRVARLHAALGQWLQTGWPGVPHSPGGDARRAAEHAARVAAESARVAMREVALAVSCDPRGSLAHPDHHEDSCSAGHPYVCDVPEFLPLILVATADRPQDFALPVERKPCGARLRRIPDGNPRRPEWTYVDETGSSWRDNTPDWLRTADDYRRLADEHIGAYSLLNAYSDCGMRNPFVHSHRPAPCAGHEHPDAPPVPECHGKPMWAAPDGWHCREHLDVVFPYAEPAGPAREPSAAA